MPRRCFCHVLPCIEPIGRKIIVRIAELGPGLARQRALAAVVVGVPGGFGDAAKLGRDLPEYGIGKLTAETFFEFRPIKPRARHSLADVRLGHLWSISFVLLR